MSLINKILLLTLLIVVAVYCSMTRAGRMEDFSSHKNVYVTEWSKLKHKAELGDPDALFSLGNFYFQPPNGSSFRKNHKKAAELYFQASLRKNPSAQYNVAIMLYRGMGFKVDLVESYAWFYLASTNDSPVAKHINRKTAEVVAQLESELSPAQLKDARIRIETYQSIIKSKRYRDARLPQQELPE